MMIVIYRYLCQTRFLCFGQAFAKLLSQPLGFVLEVLLAKDPKLHQNCVNLGLIIMDHWPP
jgi:hypothetical protein